MRRNPSLVRDDATAAIRGIHRENITYYNYMRAVNTTWRIDECWPNPTRFFTLGCRAFTWRSSSVRWPPSFTAPTNQIGSRRAKSHERSSVTRRRFSGRRSTPKDIMRFFFQYRNGKIRTPLYSILRCATVQGRVLIRWHRLANLCTCAPSSPPPRPTDRNRKFALVYRWIRSPGLCPRLSPAPNTGRDHDV